MSDFNPNLKLNESEDHALRPLTFSDFKGQDKTIQKLNIMVKSSIKRKTSLNHVLLSGPPGLGKTTLSLILANEMNTQVTITSGPVIEKPYDLAGLITKLKNGDILFIDEIHRLPKKIEEYLYSAMEDFKLDIMIDEGPNARSQIIPLNKFTLIGATTRVGLISPPLISRFTLHTRLDYYNLDTLISIIKRSCRLTNIRYTDDGIKEIAKRARGTPRKANNLINFCRDYSLDKGDGEITQSIACNALELLEIDQKGLDELDKKILKILAENYNGGPAGLRTISVAAGEESHTIEEVHEPFLIQEGYIKRTAKGRLLTNKGWSICGCSKNGKSQKELL